MALGDQKGTLPRPVFERCRAAIEAKLDALIDARRRLSDPDNARFAKRLRKQRRHLFTFLSFDGVEATNNRAERALRPAVVIRKTGACNKTPRGARTHAILSSILTTAKQRGLHLIGYLVRVLTAPNTPPSLLAAAPAQPP